MTMDNLDWSGRGSVLTAAFDRPNIQETRVA